MRTKERVREEGKRKGHASDTHQCSLHIVQFIKIIKPSLALKVEPHNKPDRDTEREAMRLRHRQAINKANALLCQCPLYYLC